MANMVNNANHPKRSSNGGGANGSNGASVANLREIYSFLEEPLNALNLAEGAGPYDRIVEMIRQLDLQDDGIQMNQKIKAIEADFCNMIKDENMLCESMNYINDKALEDSEIALKFALLFSSRNFDALAMKETKVRCAMLKILETNFLNADAFRVHDKDRLYNSITLLGEYYNRVRLADNSPIMILGESLIGLLIREIEGLDVIDAKLAKLILSQMTLNGDIMRVRHQQDITQLLFHIRRNLVEQTQLDSTVKALLLMTLDLHYRKFANLGSELESFYTKYLVLHQEQDKGNNNQKRSLQTEQQTSSQENDCLDPAENDQYEVQPTTKKWSEQVCEEAMYENDEHSTDYDRGNADNNITTNDHFNSNNYEHKRSPQNRGGGFRNSRRPHGQRSPRPPKQSTYEKRGSHEYLAHNQPQNGEEADETKPLPRWRATRFNREDDQHCDNSRNRFRRLSGTFEDDHQSVRSEGGSIRLYSINARLKHSQEKMERSNNNYSYIVNSNWDRQSQRDDRSERSYISNYEYGNKQRRGYRNYNNRPNYDKPPRFQKNRKQQQQQQQQQQPEQEEQQQYNDPQQQQQQQQQQQSPDEQENKVYSENWRRQSRANSNNSFPEDYNDGRANTLPRPAKTNFDGSIKSASFRRSQSPNHQQRDFQRNQSHRGGMHRNYNGRYGSQNSVHSEEAGVPPEEGRHQQQQQHPRQPHSHRGGGGGGGAGGRRRFPMHQQRQQKHHGGVEKPQDWDDNPQGSAGEAVPNESNELVRNARQTTEYMTYLSSQK